MLTSGEGFDSAGGRAVANHIFTLASGRTVGVSAAGDPASNRLVAFCHPTPGAGGFDPDPHVTERSGVHLVMLDRPGYGASEPLLPHEPATVGRQADDLAEYLRASLSAARNQAGVDFGSVGVVGWGTGGMVALSLAARHPELVDRVAAVSTAAPVGLAFDPDTQERLPFTLASLGVDSDDPVLRRSGLSNRLLRTLDDAAQQGLAGAQADFTAIRDHGWTRQLRRIRATSILVYGDDDPSAFVEDGRWYRRRMPRSRTRVVRVAGAGRLTLVSEWRRILAQVTPRL
jgi:pimeloyl-ACP methyl ester carboxylesterase